MKFWEAKEELKRLANGRYHAIQYQLTEYRGGALEVECYLYLDPRISVTGSNWEDALSKMRLMLKPPQKVDLAEAPEAELVEEKEEGNG